MTGIRGSDVYVAADIERILSALAGAARRYDGGEYGAGYADALRDVATGVGVSVARPGAQPVERVREVVEFRQERIVERFAPDGAPELASTDVGCYDFIPASGHLRQMEAGWMWLGNDGRKILFPIGQWEKVSADSARRLGCSLAEDRTFAIVARVLLDSTWRLAGEGRRQLR